MIELGTLNRVGSELCRTDELEFYVVANEIDQFMCLLIVKLLAAVTEQCHEVLRWWLGLCSVSR